MSEGKVSITLDEDDLRRLYCLTQYIGGGGEYRGTIDRLMVAIQNTELDLDFYKRPYFSSSTCSPRTTPAFIWDEQKNEETE